jgi:short-chain fatty acids transporter
MAFVAIGGYVVATSAPAKRLIGWLADLPKLLHLPIVLFLLWALAYTLEYHPPVIP